MIPVAFEYKKAETVEEALAEISAGKGKLLAGGYSLLPSIKMRLSQPDLLVDIANIPTLKGVFRENGQINIGAGTTHHDIAKNELIKKHLPFFAEAAGMIGDVQVRNRGTIGGSLAHADPAADWPALVLASDASIEVRGSSGVRNIKATNFFTGLFTTQLQEGEIITGIQIPVPAEGSKMIYLKFSQPASRFAIVGCAVLRFPDGKTNIAFTGVADTPFRDRETENAVSGKALDVSNLDASINGIGNGVNVLGDNFASEDYRRNLAKVYLKRALQAVA
ncbi:xanthine dehydrogenase family protein subunit M [Aquiflexum sp.]|uniref:FAD binding domain-containing protein n=1 Tax=Aquiflexum sp. TaxID=1872584 RepID=UPI003593E36D